MANCDHRSGGRRAIGLLVPALVSGGQSAGCRAIASSSLRPPQPRPLPHTRPGGAGRGTTSNRPSTSRVRRRPRRVIHPRRPTRSSPRRRFLWPKPSPTGCGTTRGSNRHQPRSRRLEKARKSPSHPSCPSQARFGFSGFNTGRITPQEKTIVMTLLFIASCPSCRTITLAPKKLIRTRRASEGRCLRAPSLARRVSMC